MEARAEVARLEGKKQKTATPTAKERPPFYDRYSGYSTETWLNTTGEIMNRRACMCLPSPTTVWPRGGSEIARDAHACDRFPQPPVAPQAVPPGRRRSPLLYPLKMCAVICATNRELGYGAQSFPRVRGRESRWWGHRWAGRKLEVVNL